MPCYREATRVDACIAALRAALGEAPSWDVVLACEQSPDATAQAARAACAGDPRFRVLDTGPQRGKGWAVRTGLASCDAEHLGFTDCDLNVPAAEVVAAFRACAAQGADLLVADRTHPGSRIARPAGGVRPLQSLAYRALVAALGLSTVRDTQCGLKVMTRAVRDAVVPRLSTDGFAFDVELIALAQAAGFRAVAFPVTWSAGAGRSRVRPLRDGLAMLRDVLRIRIRLARGA